MKNNMLHKRTACSKSYQTLRQKSNTAKFKHHYSDMNSAVSRFGINAEFQVLAPKGLHEQQSNKTAINTRSSLSL